MISIRIHLIFLLSCLIALPPAYGGRDHWSRVPIEGGRVDAFFVAGEHIYVGMVNGEMFRIADQGQSWQRLERSVEGASASEGPGWLVVATGSLLLAIGSGGRLFVSRDEGRQWQVQAFDDRIVVTAASDPATGFLYAVVFPVGSAVPPVLWRSLDDAQTWEPLAEIPVDEPGHPARLRVLAGQVFFRQGSFFTRSSDGGSSFSPIAGTGYRNAAFAIDPHTPSVGYWQGAPGGRTLFLQRGRSGVLQELAVFEQGIADIHVDDRIPGHILVATLLGLHETRDGGVTWSAIPVPRFESPRLPSFVSAITTIPHSGELWISGGESEGIYVSSDHGQTWEARNGGLWGVIGESVRFSDGRALAGTWRGLYTADDGVANLRSAAIPFVDDLAVSAAYPGVVLAADGFRRVSRSLDSGESWELGESLSGRAVTFESGGGGAAFRGESSVERSDDGGATWQSFLTRNAMAELYFFGVSALAAPVPGRVHVGGHDGVLSTYDGGKTWTRIVLPRIRDADQFFVDPFGAQLMFAVNQSKQGMARSADGGRSWAEATFPGASDGRPSALAFDPVTAGRMYLGGRSGVDRSDDGGATWRPMTSGLEHTWVWAIDVDPADPNELVAATSQGPFRFTQVERCTEAADRLCLDRLASDGRFEISLHWQTTLGGGREGDAGAVALTSLGVDRGGLFHFGNPANPEVLVKVLDGCSNNGHFWVFASAATTLGYELVVRDLAADTQRVYRNEDGQRATTITDTRAFATCEVSGPAPAPATVSVTATPMPSAPPVQSTSRLNVPLPKGGSCVADATTLCIDAFPGDRRFRVHMTFASTAGGGVAGDARALPLNPLGVVRGGLMHFGNPRNPEVLVKVLDGCANNDRFWVFFSAATTLGFDLTIEDTRTNQTRTYSNPDGASADAVADTQAFATCGES